MDNKTKKKLEGRFTESALVLNQLPHPDTLTPGTSEYERHRIEAAYLAGRIEVCRELLEGTPSFHYSPFKPDVKPLELNKDASPDLVTPEVIEALSEGSEPSQS